MKMKVFIEGKDPMARAYIGWQDNNLSLYGLKQGYKESADDLVDIALNKGMESRIDILDMYIFPIMHSYRHSIEISLKYIYSRVYGEIPPGGHDMLNIWDKSIVDKVIKDVELDISKDELDEIRRLIKELQGRDSRGDMWRYLIDKKESLYFTEWKFIDYKNLKETMNYLCDNLDGIYYVIDEILST